MQPDERLSRLETIVARLSRRQVKRIVGVVPSVPITVYADAPDADGVLARFMFPGEGIMKRACFYFEGIDKPQTLSVRFDERGGDIHQLNLFVGQHGLIREIELPITTLVRVTISATIGKFWAAFLWQPALKDGEIKNYLIDELEVANAANEEG